MNQEQNQEKTFLYKLFHIRHWKMISIYLMIYDLITITGAYFLALFLRFDMRFSIIPQEFWGAFVRFIPIYLVFAIIVYYFCGLYNSLWRFASFSELNRIALATLITTVFHIVCITVFIQRMPISYYTFGAIFQVMFAILVRFSYRYITLERTRRENNLKAQHNVMVIGAGAAGQTILKEMRSSRETISRVCCVIDDNPNKWGRLIEGYPIVGGRDSILENVEKYHIDKIMVAMPKATPQQKRDILNICKETNCELRSLPGLYQLAKGEVTLEQMKPVDVVDLLGRDPIKVNLDEIFDHIRGKVILVTGGGGSIGSELCRQIAAHEPKQLIIFDIYENNAYEIEQELRREYKDRLNLVVLIGSVRDSRRIDKIFETYHPELVYHAAAHKHVPLMEYSPNEAIKNNVIGTYITAYAALKYEAERFVLISTDKAVNPTNIMGASKRLCEMIIQTMDAFSRAGRIDLLPALNTCDGIVSVNSGHPNGAGSILKESSCIQNAIEIGSIKNKYRTGTQFVAVRFGNVLGSNGSVIPLFRKQIAEGGPVTVTHPDIVRYFMTIPEAVSLVLQAGVYAWGGEIFVLDMGEQVKIDTLARNLIRLSGLTPDVDISIEYTGLRPGEKLYEERLMAEEGMKPTDNEKIHIGKPIPFDVELFLEQLVDLSKSCYENSDEIVSRVTEVVSTFHPVGLHPDK